jgi:hypothetical protein
VTAAAIVVDVAAGGAVCGGTVAPGPLLDEHAASIIAMATSEPLVARRVRIDGWREVGAVTPATLGTDRIQHRRIREPRPGFGK